MLGNAVVQVGIFLALVTAISVPLGLYMARVFAGERTMLDPFYGRLSAGSIASAEFDPTPRRRGSNMPSRCCCSAWSG
jgi:K+-transporting ATPase ATPase A chain